MKIIKRIALAIVGVLALSALSGCFVVDEQTMETVKGTYKLTEYTYTPQYERVEGYEADSVDYIVDEGYERYLIITGEETGYLVHKDNQTAAFATEVTLSYEFSEENTELVRYVSYQTATDEEATKLGVNDDELNFTKPGMNFKQLATGKQMRSEAISLEFERVDKAIDLSYAREQLGDLKEYDFHGFGIRGISKVGFYEDSPYEYYYVAMDSAKSVLKAKLYYKKTGEEAVFGKECDINLLNGWDKFEIDGVEWSRWEHALPSAYYYQNELGGIGLDGQPLVRLLSHTKQRDISEEAIRSLIENN